MKTFEHRGFTVTINRLDGGYGYVANNGRHKMADPNPGYSETLYGTIKEAEESVKQSIFIYEVTSMFAQLSAVEQAFTAYIIRQIHRKEWIVDTHSDIVQKILQSGSIRRRR